MGRTYPPGSETYPPSLTGDRTDTDSYPPGRSTSITPAQGYKSIDVTGDPGDRTAFLTSRDARKEIPHPAQGLCDHMCPDSSVEIFSAHDTEGLKQPPDHPDPPCHRCIWCPDQRIHDGDRQNLSPGGPEPTPREPERIGPLAAKYLDQLAQQQGYPDLAARQSAALDRLRRPLANRRSKP